jgi:hypothetical protein
MDKIKRHNELCASLHETYKSKNAAYGDSFGKSFDEWGIPAAAIRITDKFNRFVNLAKHPEIDEGDEKITDTLIDMANYCIMTVLELENKYGNG